MSGFHVATYSGDDTFCIDCTGDVVVGDLVRFERAVFTGYYRNPVFAGFELMAGKIVFDSYGSEKQQHTFTLRLNDGKKILIKGRNLYLNGLWRTAWDNEHANICGKLIMNSILTMMI
jgi:hypothetical protein